MGDIHSLFSTKGITDSVRILHTPGEFARKNLLYVQEVGRLKSLQLFVCWSNERRRNRVCGRQQL